MGCGGLSHNWIGSIGVIIALGNQGNDAYLEGLPDRCPNGIFFRHLELIEDEPRDNKPLPLPG